MTEDTNTEVNELRQSIIENISTIFRNYRRDYIPTFIDNEDIYAGTINTHLFVSTLLFYYTSCPKTKVRITYNHDKQVIRTYILSGIRLLSKYSKTNDVAMLTKLKEETEELCNADLYEFTECLERFIELYRETPYYKTICEQSDKYYHHPISSKLDRAFINAFKAVIESTYKSQKIEETLDDVDSVDVWNGESIEKEVVNEYKSVTLPIDCVIKAPITYDRSLVTAAIQSILNKDAEEVAINYKEELTLMAAILRKQKELIKTLNERIRL